MKKTALICGANQGIGLALIQRLLASLNTSHVIATHRPDSDVAALNELSRLHPQKLLLQELQGEQEDSSKKLALWVASQFGSLDLVINCIGRLSQEKQEPERRIEEVCGENLMKLFKTNTLSTLFLAKHLKNSFKMSEQPVFVALSAKVGSITDNRTGGWYGYRISKTALNMAIKNISIEFSRLHKKGSVFAIHPGTTETRLTAPFIENARKRYKIHSPAETAENILRLVESPQVTEYSGKFLSWDGSELPW